MQRRRVVRWSVAGQVGGQGETFWQLTADMMGAGSTPAGHGHTYREELVPAWAGVLGFDPGADYGRIQAAIARDFRPV